MPGMYGRRLLCGRVTAATETSDGRRHPSPAEDGKPDQSSGGIGLVTSETDMPELPEVEITARRIGQSLAGVEVESALAPGMVALKSVDPPLSALAGTKVERVR